ncbi:hypothetical protein [Ferrimonas balearica]|uniref:hypothetical protein n=1 Tax=Ferrimonas balearica TaxID=44012 RepID=UPI001F226B90|nr:hypothetical protein [Ferrimonas balearica]MBY6094530.1 hypothetical protein [Ferrimonas balearica]
MWKRLGVIGVLMLLLNACTTVVTVTPQHYRMDRPEVDSRSFRPNLALGVATSETTVLEENRDSGGNSLYPLGRVGLSLGHGTEFSVAMVDNAMRYAAKWQFRGQRAEQSEVGNWSQALSLAVELSDTEDAVSCNHWCAQPRETAWNADLTLYDLAWIFGYRPERGWLLYGGPYYRVGKVAGHWHHKEGDVVTERPIRSDGEIYGANLALEYRFGFGLGLTVEGIYANTRFDSFREGEPRQSQSDAFLNFLVDYHF